MTVVLPEIEVVLDISLYGVSKLIKGLSYSYYSVEKNNKLDFITVQNTDKLIAVTDEQYRNWKSKKLHRVTSEVI